MDTRDRWKHALNIWIPRWFILFGSVSLFQDALVFRLSLDPNWEAITSSVGMGSSIALVTYALIIIHLMFLIVGLFLLMNHDSKTD